MFENIKKIQIEGGYFEQSSGLDLFDSNQCLSIIYGRNGSGKTSIAKAIRQLVGKDSKPQEGDIIAKRLADWEFTDLTFRRNLIIKGHSHRL